jgi:hypothetical protein
MTFQAPVIQMSLADVVAEYTQKANGAEAVVEALREAERHAQSMATVGGSYGRLSSIRMPHVREIKESLKHSAWGYVRKGLNIDVIAGANERKRIDMRLEHPPEFTMENIRDVFGDYILNPRHHILKGLAEIFCGLDPAFKSHSKVRIGVKGLPKRVILHGFGGYSDHGRDRLRDMLRAIAAYEGKPEPSFTDIRELAPLYGDHGGVETEGHGVRLKFYNNGNAHVYFEPETLTSVNKALAEWYGDVLPDVDPENPTKKPSTEVAKDLQYYPTPTKVVDRVIDGLYDLREGMQVLEPSCGCGRIMDAIRDTKATVTGIEYDPNRAAEAREKGHKVMIANFLEVPADPRFDFVVMNPPFYGKHYVKHVQHALEFLKPGGRLVAILPVTARYDHKILDGQWNDLPVGSFSESGTNVNTTILTIHKR